MPTTPSEPLRTVAHPFLIAGFLVLYLAATLCRPASLQAQNVVESDFLQRVWTVEDGLPVNAVTDLVQTQDGYIWVATLDGFARFDGIRFTTYHAGNTPALPSSRIIRMIHTDDGSLWLRTEQAHLVQYRNGVFTHHGPKTGLAGESVTALDMDEAGTLWIGADQGISLYRLGRLEPFPHVPLRREAVVHVTLHDRDGALWAGTTREGLIRIDKHGKTRFSSRDGLASDNITALFEEGDGTVWIGTAAGLHRYRNGELSPHWPAERPLRQHITAFSETGGSLMVAADAGWYVVQDDRLALHLGDPSGDDVWRRMSFDDRNGHRWFSMAKNLYRDDRLIQLFQHAVTAMLVDREENVWVGTAGGGLHRLSPSRFQVLSVPEGLSHRNVYPILEDREGAVWIGTFGGGLHRVAGHSITKFTRNEGLPEDVIVSLHQDRSGVVWAGTWAQGAARLDGNRFVPFHPDRLAGHTIHVIHQSAEGAYWFGTSGGLFRYEDGAWTVFRASIGEVYHRVRVIHEAPDGYLWFGTAGSGLLRYRRGRFFRITEADGLSSNVIRAIHQDDRGLLWIGTEGRGLNRILLSDTGEPLRITAYRVSDGLFDDGIHRILEDDAGRLWMSSNRGIFRVSRAELDAFAEGRVRRIRSISYTERDGMRNREANGGMHPAGIRARDGRLWFPTQDGAVVIDPSGIRSNELPPPVAIEAVKVGDVVTELSTLTLALERGRRDFEIAYTGLSLTAPEKIQFRYRLEGFDRDWVEAGTRRTAFYTNVRPGAYAFRVAAANNDGIWNEEGVTLTITVPHHFYETIWFWLLCVGAFGTAATVLVRQRLRRIERQRRELERLVDERTDDLRTEKHITETMAQQLMELDKAKSRFFANISHEFRTPLTLISGPLASMLAGRFGPVEGPLRDQLVGMRRNSERLARLINQILDLTRTESGTMKLRNEAQDLPAFVEQTTAAFASLADRLQLRLSFQTSCPARVIAFDTDAMEKVLANLLSNALKFTPAGGRVDVRVDEAEDGVEIAVRDTGPGIAAANQAHVFDRFYQVDDSPTRAREGTGIGLALARELVLLHGGTIRVESAEGRGSTFVVWLPAGSRATSEAAARTANGHDGHSASSGMVDPVLLAAPGVGLAADQEVLEDEDRTTVLVVEDHPGLRSFVRSILEPRYRVLEASNGREGLERAGEALPDLVVADVMMPEMDGFTFARALKADERTSVIPVILLTARAAVEDQIAGLETGADDYVIKPFDETVLLARVNNLIDGRRRLRERFGAPPPGPNRSPFEERLLEVLEPRLADPSLTVEALAGAMALSRSQLNRRMQEEVGASPVEYLRRARLERAAGLLRSGAGNVAEVAYASGFDSLSYFSRRFREQFGVTPSEYARSARPAL